MYWHMDLAGYQRGQITLSYLLRLSWGVLQDGDSTSVNPLKKTYTHTQGGPVLVTHSNICTPPQLSLAVKGHKPPSDSCQSQEVGIIRSINNTLKGSGRPWGWKSPDLSPLDMTCRKYVALITPLPLQWNKQYT